MKVLSKIEKIKVTLPNIMFLYCIILFILPNDAFEKTAIVTFTKPNFIEYNYTNYYLSYLYLPLIGAFFCGKNSIATIKKGVLILGILIMIDGFNILIKKDFFIIKYKSYELYMTYIVTLFFLSIIFSKVHNLEDLIKLIKVFVWLIFITLILSILVKNTASSGEYENRFSATNLSHNETGYFLMLGICLYLVNYTRTKWICILLLLIGVVATGSRSQLVYILIAIGLYFIIYFKNKKTRKEIWILTVFLFCTVMTSLIFYDSLNSLLNLDRFANLINSFIKDGFNSFLTDTTSGAPRLDGLKVGIEILKDKWLLGNGFSFFSFQYLWQLYNGTSAFPHFNIILYWIFFGVFGLAFFFLFIFAVIKVLIKKDKYSLLALMVLIFNLTNGGVFDSFKSLFLNMLFIITILILSKKTNMSMEAFNERNNFSRW